MKVPHQMQQQLFDRADQILDQRLAEGEPLTEALTDECIEQAKAELGLE